MAKTDPYDAAFVAELLNVPLESTQEFVTEMTEDDGFDIKCLFDLMWDNERNDMMSHGLSEESIFLLSSPENAKSKKIYERHQKRYVAWASESESDPYCEESLVNFFTNTYETGQYSPGSFWQMFLCIRSYILLKAKIDI